MRRLLITLVPLALLAGCLDGDGSDAADPVTVPGGGPMHVLEVVNASLERGLPMAFTVRVVTAAVSYANDLYEPTLEVSKTGVIYITGHTILVDTTGAPIFASEDDGETWRQLPFFGTTAMVSFSWALAEPAMRPPATMARTATPDKSFFMLFFLPCLLR